MTNIIIYSFFIILISTLSQPRILTDYQKGVVIPKIFRITETNNDITLEKTASEEFDKQGLLDFVQNNANVEYTVDNILHRQNEESSGVKKRWIKRIVPHQEKTPDVIFDRALGLSFKPLVRLHKTKKIQLENDKDILTLKSIQDELNILRSTFDAKKSKESLPSIHVYTEEISHLIQHLREVDAIVGQLNLPYLKRKMLHMLGSFEKTIAPQVEMLHRDILNYLSGDNDIHSLRGGAPNIEDVINATEDIVEENLAQPEEISSVLFSHLPLWNDWTYSQTLHENYCPEGQVKITNICVKLPASIA